jgi:nitrite reductase/ring-hydroxylating ferredoxin subunit
MSERRPDCEQAQAKPVANESPWAKAPPCLDGRDLVSRRDLLSFTVLTSGTLFAGTVILAVLGRTQQGGDGEWKAILPISELPDEGEAYYFYYPGHDDEAVLIHLRGRGLVAYSRRCPHLGCTVLYEAQHRRLLCPCHMGVFDPWTGIPVAGPAEHRLPRILVQVERGMVIAVGVVP